MSDDRVSLFALLLLFIAMSPLSLKAQTSLRGEGYYRTQQIDGRWWLIDGEGKRFISKGMATVQYRQDAIGTSDVSPYGEACAEKYGSLGAWRTAAATRLVGWGFNTLGAWADEQLSKITPGGKQL